MTDTTRLVRWMTLGCFLAAAAVVAGCTGAGISFKKSHQLHEQVKTRGIIVGFEGLQPFSGHRADDLTKKVAKDLDLAQIATSGNTSAGYPYIVEAHANHHPIYIVGYSLGGIEARRLAEKCSRAGIPVDVLFLLDPGAMGVFTGKIPANVRKVVFYMSGSYDSSVIYDGPNDFLESPSRTHVEFEDMSRFNHMNLPSHLTRNIRDEIREASGK